MDFYVSYTTDVGNTKTVNQDSVFVRKVQTPLGNIAFAVLCDGMGGLRHGEIASREVVAAFSAWMEIRLPLFTEGLLSFEQLGEQWTGLIRRQNDSIRALGAQLGCKLGTTATALLLTEKNYILLNIGDSRAYRLDNGGVVQLTKDHTWIEREIELGNLTREQAKSAPARNVLTRCVGVQPEAVPDMFVGETAANSMFLLCSDGFRHQISEEDLYTGLFYKPVSRENVMKRRTEALVSLVKTRGETDNISAITIYAE